MKTKYNLIELKPNDNVHFIMGNRDVNRSSVNKLKESMEKWGVLTAITVTKYRKRYFIVDGQHRFTAAKELGFIMPAIVVPKESLNVIIDLNTIQKNWSLQDYANFFSTNDDKELAGQYTTLKEILETTGLNYTALIRIFSKKGLPAFKRGELELDDMEFGWKFIGHLAEMEEYVPFAKHARFIDAYVKIVRNENYSHKRMMRKLKLNHKRGTYNMDARNKPNSFGKLMENIYNMNQSQNLVMFHRW